ncbi:Hypothetical protein PBC10988_15050 [Planctomycetales bacterium 10988]|nr:Hypothetical protein PBC10988_15050 [Planctomycetales bacterium 10988]
MEQSLQGHLLVAAPQLPDPNFNRSVVLMIQHNEEGAFGLVLNQVLDHTIADIWSEIDGSLERECPTKEPLFRGGPVGGPLMALHQQASLADLEILPGVYFTTDAPKLQTLLAENFVPFRCFIGYSGWAPQQIETEMDTGSWLTFPANSDHVFAEKEDLWKAIAQRIGEAAVFSSNRIRHLPQDPHLN